MDDSPTLCWPPLLIARREYVPARPVSHRRVNFDLYYNKFSYASITDGSPFWRLGGVQLESFFNKDPSTEAKGLLRHILIKQLFINNTKNGTSTA